MLRLRQAIITVLTAGSSDQIEALFKRVGLPLAEEGLRWGKPKYVGRALDGKSKKELLAIARRCMSLNASDLAHENAVTLENAIWLAEDAGTQLITELSRRKFAKALKGGGFPKRS